jgi:DNA-binding response OmpR family regulator
VNPAATTIKRIFLAEDDEDDFILFQDAISEHKETITLYWLKDGEELMIALKRKNPEMPDMLFLDINMPRKNGFECLTEIRQDKNLAHLPVIIFSTSNDNALVTWMYNAGANCYLCKPTDFRKLKQNIETALSMDWKTHHPYTPIEDFIL